MKPIMALPILLLLAVARLAPAQEEGEKLCGDCKCTGKISVPHRQSVLDREKDAVYCSDWMERDPEKLCIDWVVCPNCLTPSAKARARDEFDREYGKRKAWLDHMRDTVDKVTRTKTWHLETEHFVLSWSIPELKIGRRVYGPHDAVHLYAERAEEVYDRIQKLLGVTDQDMIGGKINFYMLESAREAKALAPTVTDLAFGGTWHTYKVGPGCHHSVAWDNPEHVLDDEHRHQLFAHAISHHVFNEVHHGDYTIWMFKRYGWMYEGLAFHVEQLMFGPPKLTCGQETGHVSNYRNKSWEALVKKAVLAGEDPPFQEVITRSVDALNDEERRASWSYVDYMLHLDATKMPEMLSLMKGPQLPTRDCLRQVYGLSIGQFVDGWREYVKKTYSLRPRKGPIVRD